MDIILITAFMMLLYFYEPVFYEKKIFKKLSYKIEFSKPFIFEGEKLELIQTMTNNKLMPIEFMMANFKISKYLSFDDDIDIKGKDTVYYKKSKFSFLPYQRKIKTLNLTGEKRGYYQITNANLLTGDLFGFYEFTKHESFSESIFVYPKLVPTEKFDIKFQQLMGDVICSRHLYEDPFQLRGIREYYPFDSMKSVNWSATSKTGELKVNQYDYTASQEVKILLNVEKNYEWQMDSVIEGCISLAASFVTKFINEGMSVGLISNGCNELTNKDINIQAKSGVNYNYLIYESLACIDINKISKQFNEILEEEASKKSNNVIYILISAYGRNDLQEKVEMARLNNKVVKWIMPISPGNQKDMDAVEAIEKKLELANDFYTWEVS